MPKDPRPGDPLDRYRAKRDFAKTPEPGPDRPADPPTGTEFVVHRHEASHLHYDLRLEMEGVLKSFAVPRGFSYVPEHKHLAVRTEDHPMKYIHFEGVIPKGEYGAGNMKVWDRGHYEVLGDGDGLAGLKAGKLEIRLDGGRLRGEWHLVKTKRGEKDWLLFKLRDRYARGENDPVFPLDLSRTKRSPMPKRPKAMSASGPHAPFSHHEWVFELEFDGLRTLAAVDENDVRFLDAGGRKLKHELAPIEVALAKLRCTNAFVDGVLVAPDEAGRPSRALLDEALTSGNLDGVIYYVFDLLHYDDWDLRPLALVDRKRTLESIVPRSDRVLFVDHVRERGEELVDRVRAGGLTGAVAKRSDSTYRPKAADDWRRIEVTPEKRSRKKSVTESLASRKAPITSRVKFSNRGKVYWPADGTTKGQLLEYYQDVADLVLPYLRDRPVHMLRYPDGIDGKSFYHKKAEAHIPDWVPTVQVREKEGEPINYVVCNDRDTLLYLVNLGSIDLHPWLSRIDDLDAPDMAIIDLDPMSEGFGHVIRIAIYVGKLLRGAGLRPYLKTSGATGLHIYIPVIRQYSYDQIRMFCEAVARLTVRELGDIATVERSVANREGKLYVDYLQNRKEQTLVPPYVVRPVPGAQVSAPLDWDELRSGLRPHQFDMFNLRERVDRVGDLFRGALDDPQDLRPAIEALSNF